MALLPFCIIPKGHCDVTCVHVNNFGNLRKSPEIDIDRKCYWFHKKENYSFYQNLNDGDHC